MSTSGTRVEVPASRSSKPCSHATPEADVCPPCTRKRGQMLAWRNQHENRGHQDYGVVRLSWAVPQIGDRNV